LAVRSNMWTAFLCTVPCKGYMPFLKYDIRCYTCGTFLWKKGLSCGKIQRKRVTYYSWILQNRQVKKRKNTEWD